MPNLGMGELLVILCIVLLVFGASRLPQLGESLGKAVRGLKRGLNTDDDIEISPSEKQVGPKSSAEELRTAARDGVTEAEVVERKS